MSDLEKAAIAKANLTDEQIAFLPLEKFRQRLAEAQVDEDEFLLLHYRRRRVRNKRSNKRQATIV